MMIKKGVLKMARKKGFGVSPITNKIFMERKTQKNRCGLAIKQMLQMML